MERDRNFLAEGYNLDGQSKAKTGLVFSIVNLSLSSLALILMFVFFSLIMSIPFTDNSYFAYEVYYLRMVFGFYCFIVILLWAMAIAALILVVSGRKRINNGNMSGATMYYVAAGLSIPTGLFGIIAAVFLIMSGTAHKRANLEYEFSSHFVGRQNQSNNGYWQGQAQQQERNRYNSQGGNQNQNGAEASYDNQGRQYNHSQREQNQNWRSNQNQNGAEASYDDQGRQGCDGQQSPNWRQPRQNDDNDNEF